MRRKWDIVISRLEKIIEQSMQIDMVNRITKHDGKLSRSDFTDLKQQSCHKNLPKNRKPLSIYPR